MKIKVKPCDRVGDKDTKFSAEGSIRDGLLGKRICIETFLERNYMTVKKIYKNLDIRVFFIFSVEYCDILFSCLQILPFFHFLFDIDLCTCLMKGIFILAGT